MSSLKTPMRVDEWLQSNGHLIMHLKLIYDRDRLFMRFSNLSEGFLLTTTELPLHAFAYNKEWTLCGRFSSEPPYRSDRTCTIEVGGYQSAAILRKALTPNGPKVYNFDHVLTLGIKNIEREYKGSKYQDINLHCNIRWFLPEKDSAVARLGKDGKFKHLSTNCRVKCSGTRWNIAGRFSAWWGITSEGVQLLSPNSV